jgi:superfamily II DNA helicase RecQ
MQDQVHKLTELGIPSVFLGSAQLGKSLEVQALMPDSKQLIVFVTPEWVTKAAN